VVGGGCRELGYLKYEQPSKNASNTY